MATKPLRCRLGMHAYVRARPTAERPPGPDNKVCRLCGKHLGDMFGIPPAAIGGGGGPGF